MLIPETQKVVFIDRDGVINQEPGPIVDVNKFLFIARSIEGLRLLNQQGWFCVMITNQSAFARGTLSEEMFQQICKKMNDGFSEGGAHIDDMFYCPHYPTWKEGMVKELVQQCSCRKPKSGLLDQASEKYGIRPEQAVLIGDTTKDFEAAFHWGIPSIGVKTGHAGKDGTCERDPSLWADDLYDAAQQLIHSWPQLNTG